VNVSPDIAPTVGVYPDSKVLSGLDLLISPAGAPADNGSVESIGTAVVPITFTGNTSANLVTGEVGLEQAGPVGAYTVTVTLTDNCGMTTDRDIAVEVLGEEIYSDGFE
jgi:hypothetical protein